MSAQDGISLGNEAKFDNEVVTGVSRILLIVLDMKSSRGSRRASTIALGWQPALLSPATCKSFVLLEFFSSFPVFKKFLKNAYFFLPTATEKYPVRPPIFTC